jgi:cation transport regulator
VYISIVVIMTGIGHGEVGGNGELEEWSGIRRSWISNDGVDHRSKRRYIYNNINVHTHWLRWLCEEVEMPYKRVNDLPESVRDNVPKHAQEIYLEAFNSAWDQYDEPEERRGDATREETAHRVAWAAVKRKYEKDETTGRWKAKAD